MDSSLEELHVYSVVTDVILSGLLESVCGEVENVLRLRAAHL